MSNPQEIVALFSDSPVPFIGEMPLQLVSGEAGYPQLAFTLFDVDGIFIAHLDYGPEGWGPYRKIARGSYAHLVRGADDALLLTFLSLDAEVGDGVALAISHDDGASWSQPTLVARIPQEQGIFSPNAVSTLGGRIYALWRQSTDGDIFADVVMHAHSDDDGKSWSSAEEIAPPEGGVILNIETLVDAEDRLHLFYHWRPEPFDPVGRIYHVVRTTDGWSSPEKLFGTDRVRWSHRTPAFDIAPDGRIHAAWMETAGGGKVEAYYATSSLALLAAENEAVIGEGAASYNYPNPFGDTTTITFTLAAPGDTHLSLYSLSGRRVAEHDLGQRNAGAQTAILSGNWLATGVYFYEVRSGSDVQRGRLTVVR